MATDVQVGDKLQIGTHTLASRLIVGTGKYASYELMAEALSLSGTDCITVAVRRERLVNAAGAKTFSITSTPAATRCCPTRLVASQPTTRFAWPGWGERFCWGWRIRAPTGSSWKCWATPKRFSPTPWPRSKQPKSWLLAEGFQVPVLHKRRPDHRAAAQASRRGQRDAGRQPDRFRPGNPQPEQHPYLPGISQRRRSRLSSHRRCRGRHHQ